MADEIRVREMSRVVLRKVIPSRDDSDGTPPNITGYAIKLIVKQDLELADSRAYFDLAGVIVDAANGEYTLTLTLEHTNLAPGTYPGEIRWWSDGVTTNPPTDSVAVDYVVERAVDSVV